MSSHAQVAHAFAHQTGRNRNGANMFYQGPRIYSWGTHFLLARIAEHDGRTVVFVNNEKRSVSTGQHRSEVLSACSHLDVFMVESPEAGVTVADYDRELMSARESVGKAQRARKYGDIHLDRAVQHCRIATRMVETFGLDRAPVTLETLGVAVAEQLERVARAEAAAREARMEAARATFERETKLREAWLSGEPTAYYHGRAPDGSALLRVKGETLETSLGADVPLSHAVRVFRFVKACRDKGEAWVRDGHSLRVGAFTVDRIEACGDFVAGCHRIAWSEVERIARQLGLIEGETAAA
jgi:hypothetical protein